MLFLFLVPFLTVGLRKIGPKFHGILAAGLIVVYGFLPSKPFVYDMDIPNNSFTVRLFLYIYITVSFARWYLPNLLKSRKFGAFLIVGGLAFGLIAQLIMRILAYDLFGKWWLFYPKNIPTLAVSLGLVIFAGTFPETHSRIVNRLASATLAVYLLFQGGLGGHFAAYTLGSFWGGSNGARLLLINIALAVAIYAACLLIDLLRQLVFTVTIDKVETPLFEWAYSLVKKTLNRIMNSIMRTFGKRTEVSE
ncbi:hypothetical protein KIMH_15120 [Bombiscardovia apis]|uniref:Uncharacterized protein n=2 Tax=Bombiscardovia apis TaxID=2932182 RepID=A0ABM8BEP6_9BIFI|nr:hypothetical protein KIMH_15120 [Bombiscardovia apis]